MLFNDGSLVRVGEQADFRFWPENRILRLDQGTALLFVPPGQGRTLIQTPNAVTGLQNTAVVVRYVPTRNLTLVMVLADSVHGPVSITATLNSQESLLSAGQVAFIDNTGVQIVEFDLLEFYRTSDLISGLNLRDLNYQPQPGDPIASLRPSLLTALEEQQPFSDLGSILNPALIRSPGLSPSLFGIEGDSLLSTDLLQQTGGLSAYDQAPAGVVTPLPEMLEPGNPSNIEPLEPINLANPGGEVGDSPSLEIPTLENSTVETGAAGVEAEPQ
ncbi:MAG: FecR domain-containing protein [Leptolyngbyaceae cyanobacterium SM2_3_12]|nr:FecR domain-containing protein [Leptolyngbyaceae cyanobacterium SM2_3_12]